MNPPHVISGDLQHVSSNRATQYKYDMIKTSWPISNIESHPDTVGGAGYRLYETNRTRCMCQTLTIRYQQGPTNTIRLLCHAEERQIIGYIKLPRLLLYWNCITAVDASRSDTSTRCCLTFKNHNGTPDNGIRPPLLSGKAKHYTTINKRGAI